jgi:protein-S-isoprenylcysteine O-methyltransferase Ste14
MLRLMWLPIWGPSTKLLKLGDIVYLPYMIIVYPLTLVFSLIGMDAESPIVLMLRRSRMIQYYWGKFHLDIRVPLAYGLIGIGLLVFLQGTITWLYAKYKNRKTVDFWIYRVSRHPQYLGWLIWSYGLMLLASFTPVVRGGENPGASFPWLISSLLVISVALTEEIKMTKNVGEEYREYRDRTPFLFPMPKFVSSVIASPIRLLLKKDRPENSREVIVVFLVYTVIMVLLSLPFVLLSWPPGTGWPRWPYNTWPWYRPSPPPIH